MYNKKIRELLSADYEDSLMFDNPSFDNSIIGISVSGEVIYSLSRMVDEFMHDNNVDEEEALDFISYNTLRSIAYTAHDGVMPVVMDDCCGVAYELEDIIEEDDSNE